MPRPGWRWVVNWQDPQGQVPRPCPATITVGARCPGPSWHLRLFIWTGENPLYRTNRNTRCSKYQLTMAPLWEQPQPERYSEVQCPYNLTLTSGHFPGDNWSKLDQLLKLGEKPVKAVTLKAVSVHSTCWGLHGLWVCGKGSLLLPGLCPATVRTLELFKTPPSACPQAAQLIHRPRGWRA